MHASLIMKMSHLDVVAKTRKCPPEMSSLNVLSRTVERVSILNTALEAMIKDETVVSRHRDQHAVLKEPVESTIMSIPSLPEC